ncbi:flagellar biosynthetic protein FliO [Hydrogenophaga defluvii]|uniref:Flagellar biosynthetic protein FliO n=1 Tax=Hydrogenophaga defluvii TaxID=249410 RepID=A0ABW2SE12_9BURK
MTPDTMPSFAPALMLLALLLAAAWGVKWLRQRNVIGGSPDAQAIKVISSLAVGPQQRVLVLELIEPGSRARHLLTVGVTPGQITTLHSMALAAPVQVSVGVPPPDQAGAAS